MKWREGSGSGGGGHDERSKVGISYDDNNNM